MAYSDQEIQQRASQMVGAGAEPDMVRQFIEAAKAEQGQAARPVQQATPQPSPAGSYGARPRMLEGDFAQAPRSLAVEDTTGKMLAEGGIEAVGPMAGQMIGSRMGAAAPLAIPALGGTGGVLSYVAARKFAGEPVTWGGATGAFFQGALPGQPFEAAAGKTITKTALREGANQFLIKNAETLIDEQRVTSGMEAASSAGGGAISAPLTHVVGKVTGAGNVPSQIARNEVKDAERMTIFRKLRARGAAVPPRTINRGTELATAMAGDANLNQEFSIRNQTLWQEMGNEMLGITERRAKDGKLVGIPRPIRAKYPNGFKDPATGEKYVNDIETYIEKQYEPYQSIKQIAQDAKARLAEAEKNVAGYADGKARQYMLKKNLGTEHDILLANASADVDALRAARYKAKKAFEQRQQPGQYDEYVKQSQIADSLENAIESAAKYAKDPTLPKRLKEARTNIAKANALDMSVDKSTGYVDTGVLGELRNAGVPLTGEVGDMADFHNSFYRASQESSGIARPGSKGFGAHMAMNSAGRGNIPGAVAGVAQATINWPFRKAIGSELMQNAYARPKMDWNAVPNAVTALARFMPQSMGRNNPFLYQGEDPRKR